MKRLNLSILAVVVPFAFTEVHVKENPFLKQGKPTAGDIVEVLITPENKQDADAVFEFQETLDKGSAAPFFNADKKELGRVLRSKKQDARTILEITSYKPGPLEIPSFNFVKNGKTVFKSQPQKTEYSALGGEKKQDDIFEPVSVALPKWVLVILGIFSLGLILLAIFLFEKWRRKRNKLLEQIRNVPKVLTPVEEFEVTRAEVKRQKFIENAKYKPHYFKLSEAAKRFLGKRYRINAEERTTRELILELKACNIADSLCEEWRNIFEEMDLVKFTDFIPDQENAKSLDERLSKLVARSNL